MITKRLNCDNMTKIKISWNSGSWVEYKTVNEKFAEKINTLIVKELSK